MCTQCYVIYIVIMCTQCYVIYIVIMQKILAIVFDHLFVSGWGCAYLLPSPTHTSLPDHIWSHTARPQSSSRKQKGNFLLGSCDKGLWCEPLTTSGPCGLSVCPFCRWCSRSFLTGWSSQPECFAPRTGNSSLTSNWAPYCNRQSCAARPPV